MCWFKARGFLSIALLLVFGFAVADQATIKEKILVAAREYLSMKPAYDLSRRYYQIPFPNGDIPADKGVCTDMVVRIFRKVGIDLQKLVYEDIRNNLKSYTTRRNYGGRFPDPNIDHRRVPNLTTFFERHGIILTTSLQPESLGQWQAGDIVVTDYRREGYETHIGFVSEQKNVQGIPFIIHHRPVYPVEEDSLTARPVLAHFRYPP